MAGERKDNRIERGNRTRQLVLDRTVQIASVEGLEGLSLGRLAGELELSKSGVFALFGSKEELQLATVRAAIKIYAQYVVGPTLDIPPGLDRLRQLCDNWIAYSQQRVFPGGCFFYSVTAEFDARPGPVRDALARARRSWLDFIETTIEEARAAGEVAPDTDAPQLAFELVSFLETANAESVLHDDPSSYAKATKAVRSRLRWAATDPSLVPPDPTPTA
jgi:AcrR family transcriptional regulator